MTIFDPENEVALLSILINNPQSVYSVNKVKDYMFTSTPNRTLFTHILAMANQNLLPEANLLIHSLGSKNLLSEVGSEDYIKYLKDQKYPIENINQYESLLITSYKAKKIVELGTELVKVKDAKDLDISDLLSKVDDQVTKLSSEASGEDTKDLKSVLKDSWKELKSRIGSDIPVGIPTKITWFDQAVGGIPRQGTTIVAGATSQGKTLTMINMALGAARSGYKVLYHCLEMGDLQFSERVIGILSGVDISRLHLGNINQKEVIAVENAIAEFKDLPIYVDTNFTGDDRYVVSNIKKYKKQKEIDVAFVDYAQLLVERNENMTKLIGNVSRRMLQVSETEKVGLVLGSQLSRAVDSRENKRPVKTDLKESGDLENDAHLIIMLYRDEVYNKDSKDAGKMEMAIVKNKVNGLVGIQKVDLDLPSNRILN